MSDEQRRRLEREARYDEKLADWLRCMREGHDPDDRLSRPGAGQKACKRCFLVYWDPTAIPARDFLPMAMTSVSYMSPILRPGLAGPPGPRPPVVSDGTVSCGLCHGSGAYGSPLVQCTLCGGTGRRPAMPEA